MRRLILVCLLAAPARAQEGPPGPVFFRTPDVETDRRIKKLIGHNGLGSGTRTERTKARRKLRNIGVWTVPYLTGTIVGRKRPKGVRVPMNAILTLGRILDPHCLGALRTVAGTDSGKQQIELQKTACLMLGLFDDPEGKSVDTLVRILKERKNRQAHHRAAALALGKIDHKDATAVLVAQTMKDLPAKADVYYASAVLLAGSIRSKATEPERFLKLQRAELVRRTAATCLLIRPLPTIDHSYITSLLKARGKDKVLPLLYHALARIPRSDEIRAKLLRCATRTAEPKDARVAALIGLSAEWNVRSNYKALKRALPRGRNDRVAAAMIFAIAQSGAPESVNDLIRIMRGGSAHSRFYAAGSLLYLITLAQEREHHPREQDILDALADLRSATAAGLREFASFRGAITGDLKKRAKDARYRFSRIRDPYGLHLWDWTPDDRAWALVNRLIPAVFDLDDIADRSDYDNPAKTGDSPVKGEKPETGARTLQGTPEEQDLLDFLAEQPYFGPEDLGDR